jgi:crotonobetainyl-CoA:carnitine CoA-transferase CaiB-like acyl-CoA transferase
LGRPWDRGDPWGAVTGYLASQNASDAVEGAQLLGIPASVVSRPEAAAADEQAQARAQQWPPAPWVIGALRVDGPVGELPGLRAVPATRRPVTRSAPLVVDLSALWAGPLCASLLGLAGARVVKVESGARPDGARRGPPSFFDLLNGGKQSVVIDPSTAEGRIVLARLLDAADIVVESARPRVMAQWGFDVERLVAARDHLAWVSFTAYGRTGPWQQRVGFGDDAAAAAGFVTGAAPMFCADAFADPAAGLHASVAALAAWVGGGSHLIDVALREVVGHLLVHHDRAVGVTDGDVEVAAPRARLPLEIASPLGRDTAAILAEL